MSEQGRRMEVTSASPARLLVGRDWGKPMKQVVISVCGGVAEIAYASTGVEVAIVDFDDAEAEGKSGEHKLRYWVARARRDEKKPGKGINRNRISPTTEGYAEEANKEPKRCLD